MPLAAVPSVSITMLFKYFRDFSEITSRTGQEPPYFYNMAYLSASLKWYLFRWYHAAVPPELVPRGTTQGYHWYHSGGTTGTTQVVPALPVAASPGPCFPRRVVEGFSNVHNSGPDVSSPGENSTVLAAGFQFRRNEMADDASRIVH